MSDRAHVSEVSERYLAQLGRLVVIGSRVEVAARRVADALMVDPARFPVLDDALAAAADRAEQQMPPWTAVSGDDLGHWISGARHLLGERTRLFQASGDHHFRGSAGEAVRMKAADGTVIAADLPYIDRALTRLHRHELLGGDLALRLQYLDPKGETWPLAEWHRDFLSGTKASEMAWYPAHFAELPDEWRAWLESGPHGVSELSQPAQAAELASLDGVA